MIFTIKPMRALRAWARPAQRSVAARANVDASFSKTKLMRMQKLQLLEACKELGLDADGTKDQLSATILSHFESEPKKDDIQPGEEVTMQQAAVTLPRVVPIPPSGLPAQRSSSELASQIEALDATIVAKTDELEQLRLNDQTAMETIITDHKALKESFVRNLEDTSQAMDDVAKLQATYAQVAELQQEQGNLNESIKGLSRLLSMREEEIAILRQQLDEVRSTQRQETKKITNERYALVALASHMATAESGGASAPTRGIAASATAVAAPPSVAMEQLQAAMALPAAIRNRSRAVPENSDARVFSASLPGLVIVNVGNRAYIEYAQVRDKFVTNIPQRVLTDLGAAALLLGVASLAA